MKAFVNIKGAEGATLQMRDVADPTPGPHDLLIAVKAVGLNRSELARPVAKPEDPDANIAGMEMAGQVIGMGAEVRGYELGDRVMSMTTKAYAQKALADSRIAMKIPGSMSFVDAAAIPTFFSTGHDALMSNGQLKAGESVLIAGVAAGVGIAMVQIAKAMGARLVAGSSRDAAKLARLKDLGLDLPIQAGKDDLVAACMEATQGKGIDVIADNVGAGMLMSLVNAAAISSRLITVGRLGGFNDTIDLDKIALKRMKLIGVTFRTRSLIEKIAITQAMSADLSASFESGLIKPMVDRTFAFDEALAAQEYMRSNAHLGKIVLTL
jgi:NADPH2:quinone reductase